MNNVAVDFETFYSSKLKFGLRQMIAEQYCAHEMFDAYLLAVCDGSQSWVGHPRDFNWSALEGQRLLSHNSYFDHTVFNELVKRKLAPPIKYSSWECTANMTAYLCNRRALSDAVEFLYKIKLDKSVRANADGKRWPQDFSEKERSDMLKYGGSDAYWCWRLWNDHSAKWPEIERRLSNQTIAQGMRGIQINTALLNDYIVQAHEVKLNTEKVLPWLAGAEDESWDEFNTKPTSTKCIAEMCRRVGIPSPPVKANEGEEAFEEWETTYGKTHKWISALSSWRSVNKLYKTFMLMKERLRDDGTMPFGLKFFGAHTGRWSGAEKINLQNPRKKPLLVNELGLMETNEARIDSALSAKKKTGELSEWVKYSLDFRSLLVPRPGKKMITSDLSQIEPRVLAWITGNQKLLDMIRGGLSVYEAFARANMGYAATGRMDKDSDYYKLIKIMVLGLGYQAAWKKFITIAAAGGIDITKDDPEWIESLDPVTGEVKKVSGYGKRSKEIVKEFREKSPLLTKLWSDLDQSFKRSIASDFVMKMPSGRCMTYRGVRASIRIEPDENGKPVKRTIFTAESDGRRKPYYGGILCENLVQATARDVFGHHLVALEDAFGPDTVLFTAHDEAILEVDPSVTATDVEKIMSVCPGWLEGCPIAAEAKVVSFYCK